MSLVFFSCHGVKPFQTFCEKSNFDHGHIQYIEVFSIGCTLKEDQSLRLLLNLFSEPTYKSQSIKLLDVFAACNQLNVNKF